MGIVPARQRHGMNTEIDTRQHYSQFALSLTDRSPALPGQRAASSAKVDGQGWTEKIRGAEAGKSVSAGDTHPFPNGADVSHEIHLGPLKLALFLTVAVGRRLA